MTILYAASDSAILINHIAKWYIYVANYPDELPLDIFCESDYQLKIKDYEVTSLKNLCVACGYKEAK